MPDPFLPAQPHDDLVEVLPDVFMVTGSVPFKPMVRLARNMVVLRHGTSLSLVNAVRLDDVGLVSLDALGTVEHVFRIGVHSLDDAFYVDWYGARYWSVHGPRPEGGPAVDETLTEDSRLPFPPARVFSFQHTREPEAALLIEREGGLLVTCDSVQHWAPSHLMSPLAKALTYVMGFRHPAQIGPPWRGRMTPEGGSLRPDFERMAALPFRHLVGGHGGFLRDLGPELLQATIARTYGD